MVTIRPVTEEDHVAVSILIVAAFRQANESNMVRSLRESGEIAMELIAETDKGIVGHVSLSNLSVPEGWLALAPVSVRPEDQGKGYGGELIRYALDLARQRKFSAVVVVGDPDYYHKFGFIFEGKAKLNSRYPAKYTGIYPIDKSTANSQVTLVYPEAFERV